MDDIPNSLVYFCIYSSICYTAPGPAKNVTDLKFGTHTPIDLTLVYVCIYLSICVTAPGPTKNDTDLKLGPHTPIDLI